MVFLGDGATETGVFHESLNFAVLKALPVVFVCENNLYSVYSPMEVRQPPGRPIAGLARGHGIEAQEADGNDIEAVHRLSRAAVDKARAGDGPTFLEFATYRWLEHCGPNYDNDIGYRTEDEFLDWRKRDPVELFERELLERKAATREDFGRIVGELEAEMEEAVAFAKASPFPTADQVDTDVYAP